jgi:hypothetical protein
VKRGNGKMSRTEKSTKVHKHKTAIISIASVVLSLNFCFWCFMYPNSLIPTFLLFVVPLLGIIALIILTCKSKSGLGGILAGILSIIFLFNIIFPAILRVREQHKIVRCMWNLRELGNVINTYSEAHKGQLPVFNKWCDLLSPDLTENLFICPAADKAKCHYAINSNCEPNLPNDVVLLFEAKGGWNQYGGPEMLTFENHQGEGSERYSILFKDRSVRFVGPEDLDDLNWGDEPKQ